MKENEKKSDGAAKIFLGIILSAGGLLLIAMPQGHFLQDHFLINIATCIPFVLLGIYYVWDGLRK